MPNQGYRLVNEGGQIKAIRDDSKGAGDDGKQATAGGMGGVEKKASASLSVEGKKRRFGCP